MTKNFVWETRYRAENENSVEETNERVARAIYQDEEEKNELVSLMNANIIGFNSPVYFNLGVKDNPQCSACFINSVDDSLDSIRELMLKEVKIFAQGSGSGVNYSSLRGKGAALSNGGMASGPVSFMRALDTTAGVIRSGGKLRRAARMAILGYYHKDIAEFIECKVREERKLRQLIEAGIVSAQEHMNDPEVYFQNTNHSVLVDNMFMAKVEAGSKIESALFDKICKAAWECGDPGLFFFDKAKYKACNPCAEFVYRPNSACNLAVINLSELVFEDGFDYVQFGAACKAAFKAMDRIVDLSSYPDAAIEANSRKYRPLGLGITGFAESLMLRGMDYRLCSARDWIRSLTRMMTEIGHSLFPGREQLTLIPPAGTISFYLGAESTGIEPLYARTTHKRLVDGNVLELPLDCLVDAEPSIHCFASHDPIVSWEFQLAMVSAAQEGLTGGISKTVNVPNSTTWEEIKEIYLAAWNYGLKAISVYRDGSKAIQVLSASTADKKPSGAIVGARERLPQTRQAKTHKFNVGGQEGYITVGLYPDGRPGELFITISKAGSTLQGLVQAFATTVSVALQHGAPLSTLIEKFKGQAFPPSGFTGDEIKSALSLIDYLGQWLEREFEGVTTVATISTESSGNTCPECGALMIKTGTCSACPTCGFSGGCS